MEGRAIKKLRRRLSMSQREFAAFLGVHFISVGKWERGEMCPSDWMCVFLSILDVVSRTDYSLGYRLRQYMGERDKLLFRGVYEVLRAYFEDEDEEIIEYVEVVEG